MIEPDLTPILTQLAEGRIDAAEAGRRIDALKQSANRDQAGHVTHQEQSAAQPANAPETTETPEEPVTAKPTGNSGIDRISVVAVSRRVRLVGDPMIATAEVDGPHVLRRNGRTLEVSSTGEVGPSFDGFSLVRPPRSIDDLRSIGLGKELVVRVNPAIAIDVEVTTGGLNSTRLPTFGRVRVTAAGAELTDVVEVSDMLVQAGSARISGPVGRGRSRVRVESGSLAIRLTPGANVTVRGDAHLGRISWPGEQAGPVDELMIGNGSARLDVGVVMGMASIKEVEA